MSGPDLHDAEEALRTALDKFMCKCDELENTGRVAEAAALVARLEMLFALDIAQRS